MSNIITFPSDKNRCDDFLLRFLEIDAGKSLEVYAEEIDEDHRHLLKNLSTYLSVQESPPSLDMEREIMRRMRKALKEKKEESLREAIENKRAWNSDLLNKLGIVVK